MPAIATTKVTVAVGVLLVLVVAWLLVKMRPVRNTVPRRAPLSDPLSLVINLKQNAVRMSRFADAYMRGDLATVPLVRVDAVDGQSVDLGTYVGADALERLDKMRATGVRERHQDLTPGAVGCYLSHVKAWRIIADSGAAYGFVFEDDADLPPRVAAKFEEVRAQIPGDSWDIVLLGYDGTGSPVNSSVLKMTTFLRLHAYVVSADAARRLISGMMMPVQEQVDWAISRRVRDGALEVYGAHPAFVGVAWQGTDIQSPLLPSADSE